MILTIPLLSATQCRALMSAGVSMLVRTLPMAGSCLSHIFTTFLSVDITFLEVLWKVTSMTGSPY